MHSLYTTTTLLAAMLSLASGCSRAGEPAARNDQAPVARQASPPKPATGRPETGRKAEHQASRIIGKADFTLRGKPACRIDFAYAGHPAEDLFWEESCAAVTAKMLNEPELTSLGRWERLDDFARKFVQALPDGRVLYVEGSASASVYPIGTTGATYEVPVAD